MTLIRPGSLRSQGAARSDGAALQALPLCGQPFPRVAKAADSRGGRGSATSSCATGSAQALRSMSAAPASVLNGELTLRDLDATFAAIQRNQQAIEQRSYVGRGASSIGMKLSARTRAG